MKNVNKRLFLRFWTCILVQRAKVAIIIETKNHFTGYFFLFFFLTAHPKVPSCSPRVKYSP